jgi:signal transduction histidine kinase
MKTARLTARGRLTILYTALVLAAGIMLTALTYFLMRRNLAQRSVFVRTSPSGNPEQLPPGLPDLSELAEQLQAATLSELLTQAAIALAVVTLLAAVLGWLAAGRILRPIRTISATAQHLSAENLSQRVPVSTPSDELATLARTINGMLDRIQRGIAERDRVLASQRMFTANAAHELRTPLTTMRTAIDVTLDGEPRVTELLTMAGDIRTAIGHSQRTLDGLLSLARSQTGLGTQRPADLAEVTTEILGNVSKALAMAATTAPDIALRTDLRPAPIIGEPVLLERMVSNLVDNAFRYNHTGGHVTVTTGMTSTQAFLHITNTGPPIAPGKADGLLEPFVRGEGTRTRTDNGAGLGLSIVRAIVLAHRGEISTTARPTGGLDITIHLPAHTDPEPRVR